METPKVPREPLANLKFRAELLSWISDDADTRIPAVMELCSRDVLFWLNSFNWLLEPRQLEDDKETSSKIPFASWPHQDEAITTITRWLGRRNMVISKSRSEGASWLVLMIFLHKWLFRPNSRFGVVSKNEASASSMEDTDSLLYKLNWQLEQLPPWMLPREWRPVISEGTLSNYDNGSGITAYACTDDVGVGGRKFAILFDELSRWESGKDYTAWVSNQAVSPCRIAVSTPFGPSGQYFDLVHDTSSTLIKLHLNWKQNPTKNRGMYRVVDGKPYLIDVENKWPGDYERRVLDVLAELTGKGFDVEAGVRSMWYDNECLQPGATPQTIAQELDESFSGNNVPYFGSFLLKRLASETVRPPYQRGRFQFDSETLEPSFTEDEDNGDMLIWVNLLHGTKEPPFGKYALGCDVSHGTGGAFSSLSAIVVFDATTGEQVAEFTTRNMRPDRFADCAIAIAKWFHNAKLNWDATGVGGLFTNQVIQRGYGYVQREKVKDEMSGKAKRKIGTRISSNDDKIAILGGGLGYVGFYGAVVDRKALPRSADLVRECGEYFFRMKNGKLAVLHHSDASGRGSEEHGKDHGDRVIAAALAWMAAQDVPKLTEDKPDEFNDRVPLSCWARRMKEHEEEERSVESEYEFA